MTFDAIKDLLPPPVVIEWLPIGIAEIMLYPEEEEAIRQAVRTRKLEFSAGRECGRRALRKLGKVPGSIGIGANREPIWPDGCVGSITHQDSFAMAVAAESHDIRLIGIDLASLEPLDEAVIRFVCSEQEVRDLGRLTEYCEVCPYKLLFSLKEALFKCLFPIVGQYFDFLDVHVKLASADFAAEAVLLSRPVFAGKECPSLKLQYCVAENYLFTVAWCENDS